MKTGNRVQDATLRSLVILAIGAGSVLAQTTLIDEDWQSPLLSNNQVRASGDFTGWTFNNGAYSNREDGSSDVPGDSTITFPNQVIQLNGHTTYAEYYIAHAWAATDIYYLRVEASPLSWNGQDQRYVRPELRQQDDTVLWSTAEDPTTAVPLYDDFGALTDYPSELTFWFTIDASTFTTGTAGQPIKLRIDKSGTRGLFINNVKLTLGPLPADSTAPTPDPVTWDIEPTVSDFIDISMKADSVEDDLYDVEYYFENTVRGTNSGWQAARTWAESGLDYNTLYSYRVKARDKAPLPNETAWSSSVNVTTDPRDVDPPTPDPVTWDVVPEVGDYGTITMTANPASDPSEVEYYFENTVRGTNSGWQDSTTWVEGGLDHGTLYTYRVMARDKSPDRNPTTTWSSEQSATTPPVPAGTLVITRFQSPLLPNGTGNPDFAGWTWINRGSVKSRLQGSDGFPGDTQSPLNQGIQFEWTTAEAQFDISHNWASTDVYTLTLNAAPQSWNIQAQRYIRPTLRQQDGTVLWDPGENSTTALPTGDFSGENLFGNSNWQAEPDLNFTFTIDASTFTAGMEGEPIALRLDSSGHRGLYVDNVTLSVATGGPGVPEIIDVEVDGNGNVVLTLDGPAAGLTAQQSNDLTDGSFGDVASSPGTNTLTIDASLVDPNGDGADYFRIRN